MSSRSRSLGTAKHQYILLTEVFRDWIATKLQDIAARAACRYLSFSYRDSEGAVRSMTVIDTLPLWSGPQAGLPESFREHLAAPRHRIVTPVIIRKLATLDLTYRHHSIQFHPFGLQQAAASSVPVLAACNILAPLSRMPEIERGVERLGGLASCCYSTHLIHRVVQDGATHILRVPGLDAYNELGATLRRIASDIPDVTTIVWVYSHQYSALLTEASSVRDFDVDLYAHEGFPWLVFSRGEELDISNIARASFSGIPPGNVMQRACAARGWQSAFCCPLNAGPVIRGALGFFRRSYGQFPAGYGDYVWLLRKKSEKYIAEVEHFSELAKTRSYLTRVSPLVAQGREARERMHDINDNLLSLQGILQELAQTRRPPSSSTVQARAQRGLIIVKGMRTTLVKSFDSYKRAQEKRRKNDISALVHDLEDNFRFMAQREDVRYEVTYSSQPVYSSIQRYYVERAIENVVTNAVYFAKRRVNVRDPFVRVTVGADSAHVWITVLDSGPGVQVAPHERIFDEGETTKPDGYGMGLTIAKSIVEQHAGTIDVVNTGQHGAKFTIRLPRLPGS